MRPGRSFAREHSTAGAGWPAGLDALLCRELDRVILREHRGLERWQVIGWVATRACESEPTPRGIPQERGRAVRTGGAKRDLEELVEGGVGIAAARNHADGSKEEGVWCHGGPIVHRRKDPSIEQPIEREWPDPAPILAAVKLVIAIIHNEDAGALVDGLLEKEYRATRLHSSGGFLKQSNATIVLGVEDDAVDDVMSIIAEHCTSRTQVVNPMPPIMEPGEFFMPYPLEVEVGGATVFALPVERFERL